LKIARSSSKIVNDLYVVTQNPCCESEPVVYYYSITSGKLIKRFNREIIDVSTKKTHKYFGYINLQYADIADKKNDSHKIAGFGYLISDTSIITKVGIPLRLKDIYPYIHKIDGDSETVRLHYYGDVIIQLGIKNDSLIVKN